MTDLRISRLLESRPRYRGNYINSFAKKRQNLIKASVESNYEIQSLYFDPIRMKIDS